MFKDFRSYPVTPEFTFYLDFELFKFLKCLFWFGVSPIDLEGNVAPLLPTLCSHVHLPVLHDYYHEIVHFTNCKINVVKLCHDRLSAFC